MAASNLSSPVWHVAAAVVLALVAAMAGYDGGASAVPQAPTAQALHVDDGDGTHHRRLIHP